MPVSVVCKLVKLFNLVLQDNYAYEQIHKTGYFGFWVEFIGNKAKNEDRETQMVVYLLCLQIKTLANLSPKRSESFVMQGGVHFLVELIENDKFSDIITEILLNFMSLSNVTRKLANSEGVWSILHSKIVRRQNFIQSFLNKVSLLVDVDKSFVEEFYEDEELFEELWEVVLLNFEEGFSFTLNTLIKMFTKSEYFKGKLKQKSAEMLQICETKVREEEELGALQKIVEFCEFFKGSEIDGILKEITSKIDLDEHLVMKKRIERLRK